MATMSSDQLSRLERRLEMAVRHVPYVALAVSVLLSWLIMPYWPSPPPLLGTVLIAALTAAWMLWWVTLHPRWEQRRGLMAVYYVGLVVLITVLVLRSPLFGFFAFSGYLHAIYALRGGWRIAGVLATSMSSSLSQVGGVGALRTGGGWLIYALVLAFNFALSTALTYLSWSISEQAERRKQTIAELGEANRKLEEAMAENAGLHAQLLTQVREAGVLDERQRMAREIHDTLAQGLTGIVTQLEAAAQGGAQSPRWSRHVQTATQLARDSLTEARRSVHALRPEHLDGGRLHDALDEVVIRWSAVNGVPATLTTTGTPQPLLPEIEVALLRTAQEALANVAKHARASRVGLTLSYMEDLVTLDVRDDGAGFDPDALSSGTSEGGFGLVTMRERVRRIAGTLAVESEPGAGTAVSACVPAVLAGGAG
jgi:signal transduction histidine kinase